MWVLFLFLAFVSVMAYAANRQQIALLIIILLATGVFQLLPISWFSSPIALGKPHDYAYVATALILFLKLPRLRRVLSTERIARISSIYFIFMLAILIASIFLFSYDPVLSLQAGRLFFWPLFLLLFLITPPQKLRGLVNYLYVAVTLASVLYLLQPITGVDIINRESAEWYPYLGTSNFKRYLTIPDFLPFFLLLTFARINLGKLKAGEHIKGWLLFPLFSTVILVSMTRSMIMAVGVALLHLFRRFVTSIKAVLIVNFLMAAVIASLASSDLMLEKISTGYEDVLTTMKGEYLNKQASYAETFSFRIAHFHERASYILEKPYRWPVGIGFIHEESPEADLFGFEVGAKDPVSGRIYQVDTGDIVWSIIIIKTGFIGLVLLFWFLVASYRSLGQSAGIYAMVYRSGLIYYSLISFFSVPFVDPKIMISIMLFLALALHEKYASTSNKATLKA